MAPTCWSSGGVRRYGAIQAAIREVRRTGRRVAHAHLRYLNPFPLNLGEIVKAYKRILVPEVNLGQLRKLVRAEFLVDAQGLNKVKRLTFPAHRRAARHRLALGRPGAKGNGHASTEEAS